ncbi:MAG: hypothetical protein P4L40_06095 [Terracidiphilus sp.]|nr:hypothetical protein [Terracidiphilus sp.]
MSNPSDRLSSPGKVSAVRVVGNKVSIEYDGVNGSSRLALSWRFEQDALWLEPITYSAAGEEYIVSLRYFAGDDPERNASLYSTYLVVPGVTEGGAVSPILNERVHLDQSVWLGRGSSAPGMLQQWALPVHYFCGFSIPDGPSRDAFSLGQSEAFTCGLADLPSGDLFLDLHDGKYSPWIDYRADLWKHLRGPGDLTLGATWVWTLAEGYYPSIAKYYEQLVRADVVKVKVNSEHKNAIALAPEYCTWGAQLARGKTGAALDLEFLEGLYGDLKASGMKAGLFSIDDKWEGSYGTLEHSETRLPRFDDFLARVRADGYRIGMWAAIMRCEDPASMGLTLDQMLKQPDGSPYTVSGANDTKYYIFDYTQPKVERILDESVRRFVRRYRPDVFKFDFGYELPALRNAAPFDKSFSGEKLMRKGLDVVLNAMRAEKPEIVVMYYSLSPLFVDSFDLHSTDDLFQDAGDYDVEANRRMFFSSLLGRLGIPTYGSSGYNWSSAPRIWFDSSAVGTVGSLNDFRGDEAGEKPTPEIIARYNGVLQTVRPTNVFEVLPIGNVQYASVLGAHARSWARFERGALVLFAYRPPAVDEVPALVDHQIDRRVDGVLRATMPVIVSSRNDQSITRSNTLVVAPYASGEIALKRTRGQKAILIHHYLSGNKTEDRAAITDGYLAFRVKNHDGAGSPLEWIEVQIS